MLSVISKDNIYLSLSLEVKWHIVGFARNTRWLMDHKAGPSSQASEQTPAAKQVNRLQQPSK